MGTLMLVRGPPQPRQPVGCGESSTSPTCGFCANGTPNGFGDWTTIVKVYCLPVCRFSTPIPKPACASPGAPNHEPGGPLSPSPWLRFDGGTNDTSVAAGSPTEKPPF